MNREGTVKFECFWDKTGPVITDHILKNMNSWRDILYGLNLIGTTPDGIGFGNISLRSKSQGKFFITGSGTGQKEHLTRQCISLVTSYSFVRNKLTCKGPVIASSESLSHAAIYETDPEINAVIHVHHEEYWKKLLLAVPSTNKKAEFGTPEMAREIIRLFRETDVANKRIMVMGGHKDGIITFGKDLDEAGGYLLAYINSII
ncbi:MAG: class II aldolase/adducin family protein [Bacteroidales bacterium]|nr:MAG: class II aldolase/adducin family protein [Bacteroidales bacterium]